MLLITSLCQNKVNQSTGDLKRSPLLFSDQIQNEQDILGGKEPLNSFTYFVCAGQPAGISGLSQD